MFVGCSGLRVKPVLAEYVGYKALVGRAIQAFAQDVGQIQTSGFMPDLHSFSRNRLADLVVTDSVMLLFEHRS
jgi:hypothetical protein